MLRLSAHAARYLAERDYRAEVAVNWLGALNEEETLALLSGLARDNAGKQLANVWPPGAKNTTASIAAISGFAWGRKLKV